VLCEDRQENAQSWSCQEENRFLAGAKRTSRGPSLESTLSVMYVGVGLFPFHSTGDKNFQLELSKELRARGVRTTLVSIAAAHARAVTQPNDIHFLSPPFHSRKPDKFYHADRSGVFFAYHHVHGHLRQAIELTSTLLAHMRRIRGLIRQERVAVVHWTDSVLLIPVLRFVFGRRVSVVASALRWEPRGRLGDFSRAKALSRASTVITSTESAKAAILRCAPKAHVRIAPLGSPGVGPSQLAGVRNPQHGVRLLWTGFISQIRQKDFELTIAIARRVTARRPDIEFDFCLKPESALATHFAMAGERIRVFTGEPTFAHLIAGYDALLSPIFDLSSIPAPPLTWVEALSVGVPLITTDNPGTRELLVDGRDAVVVATAEELEEWLVNKCSVSALKAMRLEARREFERRYRIDIVGDAYEEIYLDAARRRAPRG
jgi:glycosyltransferase involved in cell wall biosynthesis